MTSVRNAVVDTTPRRRCKKGFVHCRFLLYIYTKLGAIYIYIYINVCEYLFSLVSGVASVRFG